MMLSTEEDCRKGIAFWQKSGAARHTIKYVKNKENLGFVQSVNRGVASIFWRDRSYLFQ